MSAKIIISILVPMYNSSLTIARCLDSLCVQSPKIFEIVVIDDGSNDSSYEIVKAYSKQYNFIRIYGQSNQGVAKTRQNLIQRAKGKYIMFCDSDDYFEVNAVQSVCNAIQNSISDNIGVYIFGYNLIRNNGKKAVSQRKLRESIHSKNEFAKYHIKGFSDLYWSALWNKCYRRDLCIEPEICFEELMEDVIFNIDYMARCQSIYISSDIIYNYVQIGNSITRSKVIDNKRTIIAAYNIYKILGEKAISTYPNEDKIIMEYIYILFNNLYKRTLKVNDNNTLELVWEQYQAIKNLIGIKFYILDLKIYIKQLGKWIKNILKASSGYSYRSILHGK